jgi:hypothetical protein
MSLFDNYDLNAEIDEPVICPEGTYKAETVGKLDMTEKDANDNHNGFAIFNVGVVPTEPEDDVDEDEWSEYESGILRFSKFVFANDDGQPSKRQTYALQQVLRSLGFEGTIGEAMEKDALKGYECRVVVEHEERNGETYANVARILPIDDD